MAPCSSARPRHLVYTFYDHDEPERIRPDLQRVLTEALGNLQARILPAHGLLIPRLGEYWWN